MYRETMKNFSSFVVFTTRCCGNQIEEEMGGIEEDGS
jgi:hypothetical protein